MRGFEPPTLRSVVRSDWNLADSSGIVSRLLNPLQSITPRPRSAEFAHAPLVFHVLSRRATLVPREAVVNLVVTINHRARRRLPETGLVVKMVVKNVSGRMCVFRKLDRLDQSDQVKLNA